MLMKTTPFYARLNEPNQTGLYGHWAGYLSAPRYDLASKHEYFAVRNSAGYFDSSPLYKYRITGPDAEKLLASMMTRDVRRCRPGQAMYTVWSDDAGYVLEDGVVFRRGRGRLAAHRGRRQPGLPREPARPAAGRDRGRQ